MGCGCGKRRSPTTNYRTNTTVPARLQAGVTARQVQTQSNQRQALLQRAKEQLQQKNGNVSSQSRLTEPQKEIERKRRIQVSLRNRRTQGNQ